MLTLNSHKQAAKAAVARMAVHDDSSIALIAIGVQDAIVSMGLQVGDLISAEAIAAYAFGVQANGEKVSNRRWKQYPADVKKLAGQIVDHARTAVSFDIGA